MKGEEGEGEYEGGSPYTVFIVQISCCSCRTKNPPLERGKIQGSCHVKMLELKLIVIGSQGKSQLKFVYMDNRDAVNEVSKKKEKIKTITFACVFASFQILEYSWNSPQFSDRICVCWRQSCGGEIIIKHYS